MPKILAGIEHIVVVMLENRSLDNMLGSLYTDGSGPALVLPRGGPSAFDGLRPGLTNPSNPGFFSGGGPDYVPVRDTVQASTVPDPDPEETFVNVTFQLFGPEAPGTSPRWPMQGFRVNYAQAGASDPDQILQCHGTAQLPILAALARSYAVSDAWFASVPSQTWANRAFVHAGTSNGHVDNGEPPDPLEWDVRTIYPVLGQAKATWAVYHDTEIIPSLTRTMFPELWPDSLDGNFRGFAAFLADCANDSLPQYSFLEPSFLLDPNDDHPPHDVNAGEAFLRAIWDAVSGSAGFARTLLVITFDEHGGCYDHVLPPFGAAPPDTASTPGDQGFGFDRFGVRVPTVVVSPWITAGTVFRSDAPAPYDHASILATLRDWLTIPESLMLPSRRIAAAPTLGQLVTLSSPRTDIPSVPPAPTVVTATPLTAEPNPLQRSLVSGTARRYGIDPRAALATVRTRQDAADFLRRRGVK
ncbi:MAG TPA: alkaline phosphatase family protein [Steroidobacteraceae bacterium]|jgi:phospholipase C|nr:alkaline phosphatase family protein [Steroidobacteraceae bacterium]